MGFNGGWPQSDFCNAANFYVKAFQLGIKFHVIKKFFCHPAGGHFSQWHLRKNWFKERTAYHWSHTARIRGIHVYSGRGTPEFRESGSVDLLILSLEPVHCRTRDHLETDTSSPCKTILGSFLASDINDVTAPVQGIVPFFNGSHTISARLPPTRGQSGCTECAEGHIALSCLRLSNSIRPCRCFLVPFLLKQILQLCSVCWRCVLGALGGSCSCTRNVVLLTTLYCFVAFFVLSFFSMFFDLNYWK